MSELSLGTLSGLAANSYVVDVAAGSSLDLSAGAVFPAGSIIQVVSTTKTDTFTTSSTSFTDITGLTASITPSSTSSKILALVTVNGSSVQSLGGSRNIIRLARDVSAVGVGDVRSSRSQASTALSTRSTGSTDLILSASINYLDSPSTVSSITYSVQAVTPLGSALYINRTEGDTDSASNPTTISTITLMEVAG